MSEKQRQKKTAPPERICPNSAFRHVPFFDLATDAKEIIERYAPKSPAKKPKQ